MERIAIALVLGLGACGEPGDDGDALSECAMDMREAEALCGDANRALQECALAGTCDGSQRGARDECEADALEMGLDPAAVQASRDCITAEFHPDIVGGECDARAEACEAGETYP